VRWLEEAGGRSAVLAGGGEGDAGAGVRLGVDGRMTYELGEEERRGVDGDVARTNCCDHRRVGGAAGGNGRELR
jgi:hypothetical protein